MNTTVERPTDFSALPEGVPPRLIGIEAVSKFLGLSTATVERMHAAGRLPMPRKFGRRNIWDVKELEAWIARAKADGTFLTRKEWRPIWDQLVKTGKN